MLLLRFGLCSCVSSGIGGGAKGKSDGMPGGARSAAGSLIFVLSLSPLLLLLVVRFLVVRGEWGAGPGVCARVALERCGMRGDFGVCGSVLGVVGVS